jgi:hypothetical protein
MADGEPVSRRTALQTIGTTAAVATGLSTTGTATESQEAPGESPEQGGEESPEQGGEESPEQGGGSESTGFYSGTVDRVVDGEHVVILVEAGGRVVDQHVVPAAEYPSLEEGDAVYLLIVFGRVIGIWKAPGE